MGQGVRQQRPLVITAGIRGYGVEAVGIIVIIVEFLQQIPETQGEIVRKVIFQFGVLSMRLGIVYRFEIGKRP